MKAVRNASRQCSTRLFNVIDDFNREGLAIEVDLSLLAVRALDNVIEWRGKLNVIRSDNGPKYVGHVPPRWAKKRGILLEHIQRGNPQQNAYIKRYNRTVCYDWLGHYLFESIVDV